MTLQDLAVGARGRVTGYRAGERGYRKKLLAMGLTPGAEVAVVRVAPMGDPVEIEVRGSRLSLRREEAATVMVEPA